jgi:hypothetical protein
MPKWFHFCKIYGFKALHDTLYVSRPCMYCIVFYYTPNSAPIRIKLNWNTSWSTIQNIHCSLLGYDTMLSGTWVPVLRRYTLLLHSGPNSEIPIFLENFRTNAPGYNTVLQLRIPQHVLLYLFLIMKQQTAFAHVCVYTYMWNDLHYVHTNVLLTCKT